MKVSFFGTPDFAVAALQALVEARYDVVAVYTQPPRPAHRGKREQPTPVHQAALDIGLPVHTPSRLRDPEVQAQMSQLNADVGVVAAYGLILPREVLNLPPLGCLNIHASLLPRWRGAAPIQRAIEAGDEETGITIMQMDAGLDTGDMLLKGRMPISPSDTSGSLHDKLAKMGSTLIVEALDRIDSLTPAPQPEQGVTYAHKIDKSEAQIDWAAPAAVIERKVRALAPSPGAFFQLRGERVKLLGAQLAEGAGVPGTALSSSGVIACGLGALQIVTVQRAGKAAMPAQEMLRGWPIEAGTQLA